MSGGLRKVLKCLSVTFMLIGYSSSQFSTPNGVNPTTYDPCFVTNQLVQEPRSGGRSFSDNLVCPGTSLCFPQEELCNGVNNQDCTGGADEGVNIVSLDCGGTLSQAEENVFVCTPGDNIPIVELCDGINDCQNGDDETTALCANKCLGPYAGGCNDLSRVCISSPFDVNCGDCFVGFEPNPASPANPPPCVLTQVVVGFEFQFYNVFESNQQVVCLVISAAPLINDVVIQVTSIQSGAAIAGLDFVPINAGDEIVTFPASSIQPQCIFVQTIQDDIAEVEECFTLGAALLNGFATVDPDQTTVCIQDDDFIQYEIDAPAIVTEGTDTFAEVCVRLIVGQLAQPTQVDLTIQQGTAFDGEDFSSAIATTVVFPAGTFPGGLNSEQCINIPIINDQRVELTESFSVSAGPAVLDFPNGDTAIITILDDDVAVYQFTQITYQNSEGNNLAAAIELISGILTFDMDIQVVTNDFIGQLNAATENDDYDPLTQFVNQVILTFPAGSSPITQQPLEVELFDDNFAESTESFQLSAFSNSNQAGFTQGRDVATGLILDNDVCQIGFEEPSYTTEEGNAQEICLIKLNNVQLGGPLTVNVQTTAIGSTKTEGQDYNQFNGQVIFGPNSFRECVTIQTLDDNIDEPLECVQINAVPANNAQSIQILQSQTEVCCLDNDDNTFQFVDIVIDVPEQGPQAQCCIELVEGLLGGQVIIEVDVEPTVPMSAQVGLGLDVSPNVATLFFPAGTMPNTPQAIQCFPTTVLNDNQVEDTESYLLVASSNSQGVLFTPGRAVKTVNIIEDPNDNVPICLEPPTVDTVSEDVGSHQECVEITGLQNRLEKIVSLTLSTSSGPAVETDAQDPMDYIGGNQVIFFDPNNQNGVICVDIPIVDDAICENDESFTVNLMSNDPCVTINQFVCTGTVIIADNDVATVQSTQPSYSVNEGETVHIDFQLIGQKGPGRECVVTVTTMDGTALSTVAWRDYFALPPTTLVFDSTNTFESIYINVCDDSKCEGDEEFEVILSTNSNGCEVGGVYTVTIIDDEVDTHGLGDDPHFSIALPSGELLCYTVQGEHGFSFNLISNHKMAMNAKFVPDARREEVTWLGSIGIIVKNTNYKGSNETKLRFDVDTKSIYIGDKVQLEARNIEKLTFSNGKLTISEAPPKQGFHYPSVYVDLEDVQLQFTIKYTNQHLDIYWHSTGGRLADSHGLIGQFFRKGVEIDEVRKILIMPSKEPIPVMRRPVWSFMERENPDEQLCWTAMNSGYQGEGLIDGTYFDYLVDDVLSTDFKFEKQ